MALNDLTDQNIQDTYQKVVQTDGTNLADGTGSLLPISFDGNNVTISGSLTANEYIVSSSVTNITIATLSGSTTFGDSADDTHTFTGAITASTDISASGDIYGTKFQAYNGIFSGSYLNSSKLAIHESDSNTEAISLEGSGFKGTLLMKYNNASRVYLDPVNDSYIWTNGDLGIGHNSPSYKLDVVGTGRFSSTLLVGNTLTVQGSSIFGTTHPSYGNTNAHTFIGHITASDNISASAAGTVSAGSGSFHVLKGDTTSATGLSVDGYIEATHITASGNISASGTLKGDAVHVGSLNHKDGTNTEISFNTDQVRLNAGGIINTNWYTHGVDFALPITASGNISASGNIVGVTGSFDYVKTDKLQVGAAEGTDVLSIDGGDLQLENGKQITFADIGDGNTGRVRIVGNEDNDTISMHVDNSTTKNITLTTTGVGIGTTSPGEKLEVVGNISASGHLMTNQSLYVNGKIYSDGDQIIYYTDDSELMMGAAGGIRLGNSPLTPTHVTASGNISASGDLFSDNATITTQLNTDLIVPPSTNLQIGADNNTSNLLLRGHITASGNISASVSINSKFYYSNGEGIAHDNGTTTFYGNNKLTEIDGTNIKLDAPVTASGNISSSGRVYGTHFGTGNANRNALDLGTDNTMQFRVNDGSRLTLTSTQFRPSSDEGVALGRTAQKWSELVVNHVTASGNISASGTGGITATRIKSDLLMSHDGLNQVDISDQGEIGLTPSPNQDVVVNLQENNGVGFSIKNNVGTTTFRVDGPTGNVTASGNISSSATIIGNIISGSTISGSFVGDGSGLTNIPSPFTAAGISGSFTEASASFSTRVTANDAKVGYTDAAVKTKLNTEGVLSSSAQLPTGIISSSLQDLGNITGSNISASGNIYSNNFDVLMAGSFKATSTLNDNYAMPGNTGINNTTWGFQFSDGASGLGNTSQHVGVMVPYKCQLVGVVGNIRSTATGDVRFALWTATLVDGGNSGAQTWTKSIETDAINITAGSKVFKYSKIDGTVVLDAFDTIVPTIKNETGTTNTIYGSYTILIRRVA